MGKKATLFNLGGEGSPRYQFIEEKGNHEDNPDIDKQRKAHFLLLPDKSLPPTGIDDMSTGHMSNWLDCMRSRHQPVATVRDGFAQSVASIMAAQSYFSGKKLYWDAANEEIVDRVPQPF